MKIKALKTFKWKVDLPKFEQNKIYDVSDSLGIEMIDHSYAVAVKQDDESHKSIKTVFEDKMKHLEDIKNKENTKTKSNKQKKVKIHKKRNKSVK